MEVFASEICILKRKVESRPRSAPKGEATAAPWRRRLELWLERLEVERGLSPRSVASYRGLSVRVAYGWDIKYKRSVVSVDFLYGVKLLDAKRAVLLKGANKTA